jgi:phosphoribosylanthranilate isomerase
MIKVKICGMRDPLNIEAVTDAGPDYLGFIFYPGSARFVGTNPDESLFNKVKAGVKKVGVFVNEKPEKVIEIARHYALEVVQLHGSEPITDCKFIRSAGFKVIKAFGIDDSFNFIKLVPYLSVCEYFLFDKKSDRHGGSGLKFNWDILFKYDFQIPFFLSGGIGPKDIKTIKSLNHSALYAVDINSGFEITAGIKDTEKVKAFIKEIKMSNYELLRK